MSAREIVVSTPIMKAAKLFADRPSSDLCRPALALPWAMLRRGKNILAAFDGHTMFVANDAKGENYPKKPTQVGGEPCGDSMPNWMKIVRQLRQKRRAIDPVAANPKYHARVMRAASILEVDIVVMSIGRPSDELLYTLGPDAYAIVMPMRHVDKPAIPRWLTSVVR